MQRLLLVGGARPNFMKLAPLGRALQGHGVTCPIVHTGQHYDPLLSDIFFEELSLPRPTYALGVGSGDRITQTRAIVRALTPILRSEDFDAVLVVGDVTSTLAASMAALAEGVPVVHVEAGLRSFNWRMAEELNRVFVDHHAEILFTTEAEATQHLMAEGIERGRIHEVGNVMIDTMRLMRPRVDASQILEELNLTSGSYGVVTLHRSELLQNESNFTEVWRTLLELSQALPCIFPVHPRTRQVLERYGLSGSPSFRLIDPLGYADMQRLVREARCVFTDSGGLQEETTVLHVPCITLREETERPITVREGTSVLVGYVPERIRAAFEACMRGEHPKGRVPALWDGHAAERIAAVLASL